MTQSLNIIGIRQDGRDATATRFQQWLSDQGISDASPGRAEFFPSWQLTPQDRPPGEAIRSPAPDAQ